MASHPTKEKVLGENRVMNEFVYERATSARDAVRRQRMSRNAKYLAGGQTLLPSIKQELDAPSRLVDLSGAGLDGISRSRNTLSIGAMTCHADVQASKQVSDAIPALGQLAGGIGDAQVRNRGTIGGSIANSDPAADYPAALLALQAVIHTNLRKIPADQYFLGLFQTALRPGELINKIEFEIPSASAYVKFPNPASRYAIVGVFAARFNLNTRIGVTGASHCAFRWTEAESHGPGVKDLSNVSLNTANFNSDLHASATYRAHLVRVMTLRALSQL